MKNEMAVVKVLFCLTLVNSALAKGSKSQIECTPELMKVTIPMDGNRKMSYLDQMKDYSPCKPGLKENIATYILDLQDPHKCGVTRVLDKRTGTRTFYHKVVIEDVEGARETVTVRCVVTGKHALTKRDVDFPILDEPDVNITRYEEGHAAVPILGAIVKQNGKQVSGEISVSPGTPLSMEIFLDEVSAPVYGLLVNYMHVTDTGVQQETIIFNGCSVDPFLFDNFVTTDGDVLAAKFKAFKFPDSIFVQFKASVSVCLDKCQGVQCSNGATGYGRRRRSVGSSADANRLYEVALSTFIKVDLADGQQQSPKNITGYLLKNLQIANQKLEDSLVYANAEEVVQTNFKDGASGLTCSCLLLAISVVLTFLKV